MKISLALEAIQWMLLLWILIQYRTSEHLEQLENLVRELVDRLRRDFDKDRGERNDEFRNLDRCVRSVESEIDSLASNSDIKRVQSRIVQLKQRLLAIEDYLNAQLLPTTPSEPPPAMSDAKSLKAPSIDIESVQDSVDDSDSSSSDKGADPGTVDIMEALRASLESLKESSGPTPSPRETRAPNVPQRHDEMIPNPGIDGSVDSHCDVQETDLVKVDIMEALREALESLKGSGTLQQIDNGQETTWFASERPRTPDNPPFPGTKRTPDHWLEEDLLPGYHRPAG